MESNARSIFSVNTKFDSPDDVLKLLKYKRTTHSMDSINEDRDRDRDSINENIGNKEDENNNDNNATNQIKYFCKALKEKMSRLPLHVIDELEIKINGLVYDELKKVRPKALK